MPASIKNFLQSRLREWRASPLAEAETDMPIIVDDRRVYLMDVHVDFMLVRGMEPHDPHCIIPFARNDWIVLPDTTTK